ncbi:MAG: type I methionyl aminopeptidase [Chloroherpetonaceae bacterium]|nr:type I methionyl aminopeptidase [Chthonomonadaceae bacterium]MDW8207965.1 type I methionyl aminopeptidase [Chloroherpetonaceae bacterium]
MRETALRSSGIHLKTREEIEKIRAAGRVVHRVLRTVGEAIRPGVTTGELEDIASRIISESGGTSPFLGYAPNGHPPYPAYTCISVNDEIVHGIPGRRVLQEGDIVTIDCGVELDGYIGDSAWTFPVGRISPRAARLLKVTEEALYKGIAQARPGKRVADISRAIQHHAESHGYSVVRELTGHGVGRALHEEPQIPNFVSRDRGPILQCGMTFAIEPMVNAGRREIRYGDDRWTILTEDGSLSAHFEHTIAIVPSGALILTNGE